MPPNQLDRPAGYPVEWEADVLLTDGGVAHLRPIRPSDAGRLVAFYDRVSPESKYLRFFAPYPRLSERDVKRFTTVDYVDRVAFIVTLGDEMIAVGRYDRTDDTEAEVAFLIEDAHQGRGIAQLLLEHLAEAARERGVTGFYAEVLPQNRAMAQVFADAGYRVQKGIEDGVLMVHFPILPTNTSVGVMERREHRAESASIRRLLAPERVVAYGRGGRVQELVNSMLRGGYRGEIVAVSTDDRPVAGVPTANDLSEIGGRVDLALVSAPTSEMGSVVIDVAHRGAHAMVVMTGTDFTPSDNQTIINLARAYGVRALGPDALGVINTASEVGLNASPAPMPRLGGAGMFCQSAAIGVAMLNHAVRQDLGLSSFISTGDYADVTANDVMQFWEDDEATRVCLLSLDAIGNPRKFSRITRRLARRKPVVVFAPGRANRSSYGGSSSLGHAPDEAVDALFRQAGVMVVHRRGALIDIGKIAARQPLPSGPRVRLITNSKTLAGQMIHAARAVGLLPEDEATLLGAVADPIEFAAAAREALADPTIDSVVCAAVNVFSLGTEAVIEELESVSAEATKPLIGVFLDFHAPQTHEGAPDLPGHLPRFDAHADAIQALSALSAYAHWRNRDPGAVPMLESDPDAAKRVVNRVLSTDPHGRELTEAETAELLRCYDVAVQPKYRVTSLQEAIEVAERLGWNVVLKASAKAVRGRQDLASVHRNIDDVEEITWAWADLGRLLAESGLPVDDALSEAEPLVQAMAPAGVALVISSREDAAFGPMISLGLEGISSELLGDTVYRVPPLTTVDAAAMVRDLRAAPVLFGRHGSVGVNTERIEDLLHRVAQLADDHPQIASLTLSPCLAGAHGITVLSARVVVAPTPDQRDPLARGL